jgi:hypothetical protein
MTQGLPPKPTIRSIVLGFLLAGLLCIGVVALPTLVKYAGAVLTFIPAQLRLIRVVTPGEVMPVDMSTSPTSLSFGKRGAYTLFTDNYDLLVINDAVAAAGHKPWFKVLNADGDEVDITLVERGMALYDTPFARGRPVARFEIARSGTYSMIHPTRTDYVYLVPDYTFGNEGWIMFLMVLQVAAIVFILWRWWNTRQARSRAVKAAWKDRFSRPLPPKPRKPSDGESFNPGAR